MGAARRRVGRGTRPRLIDDPGAGADLAQLQRALGPRTPSAGVPAVRRRGRLRDLRRRRDRAPGVVGARRRGRPARRGGRAAGHAVRVGAVARLGEGEAAPGRSSRGARTPARATGASPCSRASRSGPPARSTCRSCSSIRRARVLLHAEIDVDGTNLTVVATHFSHLEFGSPLQTRALRRGLPPADRPAALVGDMNMWGWTIDAMTPPGWRRVVRGKTWPAPARGTRSTTSSSRRASRWCGARCCPTRGRTTSRSERGCG